MRLSGEEIPLVLPFFILVARQGRYNSSVIAAAGEIKPCHTRNSRDVELSSITNPENFRSSTLRLLVWSIPAGEGVRYFDLTPGNGQAAEKGDRVSVRGMAAEER